jgi:tetratricopeptide (TPR) repeat protein
MLGLPRSLAAEADGGARSVFATGAGDRALGMGGAYAAIADDASAALWNPGGLPGVARRTFGASHARLYGMGFEDQYAGLVLPHWRFGTFSLTAQRFAVDGISVRDARNVELDSDASNSQMQVTLAYGMPIGRFWSAGAALKYQRHELLDLADAGVGIDLGVLVRAGAWLLPQHVWAQPLRFGLAFRNALEPTIRLRQDEVRDPLAARAGLAYELAVSGGGHVVLALDVEKTGGMGPNLHTGAEYQPHPTLALRAGIADGAMSAGGGVRWRDLSFDYVFENTEIEPVHRVGATFRFGANVDETRAQALAARAARAEAELARAYEERKAERVTQLLQQAQAAQVGGRHDAALQLLATISVLSPDNVQARDLKITCLLKQASAQEAKRDFVGAALTYGSVLALRPGDAGAVAGQERCHRASDQFAQRDSAIRLQFSAALHAFGVEDFVAARQGFQKVLDLRPDDAEAQAMLKRTRDAIALRARNLVNLAQRFIESDNAFDPTPLLEQARALDPSTPGLQELTAQAKRLAQRRAAKRQEDTVPEPIRAPADQFDAAAARRAAELAAKKQRAERERMQEAEAMYTNAMTAMQEGRSDDALRFWELAWGLQPSHAKTVEHLKREYLMRGMDSFSTGDLPAAIAVWQKALTVDPSDQKVVGYLTRAQEQLARTREILGQTQKQGAGKR